MSYSIKHTTVSLTCEQFRAIISALEVIAQSGHDEPFARDIARTMLGHLVEWDVLSEHDYPYGVPLLPRVAVGIGVRETEVPDEGG